MNRTRRFLWLFATVLAASPQLADAATVVRTTSGDNTFFDTGSFTFSFANITSADQLVSISAGGAGTPESGPHVVTISVRHTDNTTAQIFTQTFGSGFNLNFSSLGPLSFALSDINAVVFSDSFTTAGTTSLPSGMVLTFHTADPVTGVPEPIGWAMMIGGFAAVGAVMRGRRRRPSFSPV